MSICFSLLLFLIYPPIVFAAYGALGDIQMNSNNNLNVALENYQILHQKSIPQSIIHANFIKLKNCILKRDIECVGSYIVFSNTTDGGSSVGYNSGPVSIKSMDEFKKNYDKIITRNIIEAFKTQQEKEMLFPNSGAMIGTGQIWLNYFCNVEKQDECYFKIYSIFPNAKFVLPK